jgi:hypothetical protein
MSLFQCSKCGCVEDTALRHYWSARLQGTAPMCSACDPKIAQPAEVDLAACNWIAAPIVVDRLLLPMPCLLNSQKLRGRNCHGHGLR